MVGVIVVVGSGAGGVVGGGCDGRCHHVGKGVMVSDMGGGHGHHGRHVGNGVVVSDVGGDGGHCHRVCNSVVISDIGSDGGRHGRFSRWRLDRGQCHWWWSL